MAKTKSSKKTKRGAPQGTGSDAGMKTTGGAMQKGGTKTTKRSR